MLSKITHFKYEDANSLKGLKIYHINSNQSKTGWIDVSGFLSKKYC